MLHWHSWHLLGRLGDRLYVCALFEATLTFPRLGDAYFLTEWLNDVAGTCCNKWEPPKESLKFRNWSRYCLCSTKHELSACRKSTLSSCCIPRFVFTGESEKSMDCVLLSDWSMSISIPFQTILFDFWSHWCKYELMDFLQLITNWFVICWIKIQRILKTIQIPKQF